MEAKAQEILGHLGAMISGSKSGYSRNYPDNFPVFNSNIIAVKGDSVEKIWFGDIDVTKSAEKLEKLAIEVEADIYVLREMDARFENENKPRLENFSFKVTPTGERALGQFEKKYYNLETLRREEK